jgi:hypothetical protein
MQNFHDGWEWLCSWILTPACDSTAALPSFRCFSGPLRGLLGPRRLARGVWPPPPSSKTRPGTCNLGGIPRIVHSEHDNCQSTPSASIICNRHLFDRVGEQLLLAFRLAFLERWFVGSRRGESATVYQPPTKERQSEDDVGGRLPSPYVRQPSVATCCKMSQPPGDREALEDGPANPNARFHPRGDRPLFVCRVLRVAARAHRTISRACTPPADLADP